jgi:two-component system chemotaxis response regulator CheB
MTATSDERRDTIVLGASAGGIVALQRLLPALGDALDASVFIVLHIPAHGRSILDTVLGRSSQLEIRFAQDGEAILPRRVYVAPPDRHLMIRGDRVQLSAGPRENSSRPAIDALFRSAAVARQGRVMAGVLSGLLDDGAAGLSSVKRCGGLAFVQQPGDAEESEMPSRAAAVLGERLDGALPAEPLGQRLRSLVGSPAPRADVPEDIALELEMSLGEVAGIGVLSSQGSPVPVSCPECGGPLWGIMDGRLQRFRCHTGHSYGVENLLSAQSLQIEQALWAAIKGLEQRSQMLTNMARDENVSRRVLLAQQYQDESRRLTQHAHTLRDVLVTSTANTELLAAPHSGRVGEPA